MLYRRVNEVMDLFDTFSNLDRFLNQRVESARKGLWAGVGILATLPVMVVNTLPATAQIAGSILSPLVAAWIRTEVDQVENLNVQIAGADADILNGVIPQASISGTDLLYQGFQVNQLQLTGQNIRLNVGDAIQGQPLRLLAPVPVQVNLQMTENDLNQTLSSPAIQEQLAQAQVSLPIAAGQEVPFLISDPNVTLEPNRIRIEANLSLSAGEPLPVTLTTGLTPQNQNQLLLTDPNWVTAEGQILPIPGLEQLLIQLDPDVRIDRLELQQGLLHYEGQLMIQPEEVAVQG